MNENNASQSVIERLIEEHLPKIDIKVKKLQYTMDFGTTEVAVKLGLN